MHLNKRLLSSLTLLALYFMLPVTFAASSPLEQTISRRQSIREYTSENITGQQLLQVLHAAYGLWSGHRSIPKTGYDYSLIVFVVNETGNYRYIPESNTVALHDLSVNKETIRPYDQGWPSDANIVLIVVWNQTKMSNGYFASAEAGCLVQNVHLATVSLNLGTCCVGGVDSEGLRNHLKLTSTLIPLLVMPLGHPKTPYPAASPNYDLMTGNLPLVQYGKLSFEDALDGLLLAQAWSTENLSLQELSQLLWAAYGYTNVTEDSSYHRTTPSAHGIYPLVIYVSNTTGVYRYLPENHSLTQVLNGDRRFDITKVCSSQNWATKAPAIFLIVFDSPKDGDWGGPLLHEFAEVDAGAVIQQLSLESSAWNLTSNVISEGLEEWNGTNAEELRNILGLSSSLVPLYLVPIGHKTSQEIGYSLDIHVKDWDLIDDIPGAYVYKNSEWKISDEYGWANWTGVNGKVEIKVKWLGTWVSGPFTIQINANTTIDIKSNIFDIIVTSVEQLQQAFLQYVNVIMFAGTNKIGSWITDNHGKVSITNVPNSTLTITEYDGKGIIIANTTRTITTEDQHETIICNQNYVTSQSNWRITEVSVSSLSTLILIPLIVLKFRRKTKCLNQYIKTMCCKHRKVRGGIQ